MFYLIILFLVLYAFLAYRRLEWSLMLFLFALPSYQIRFDVFAVPATLLEAMILISFAAWFFKNRKNIIENLKCIFKNLKSKIINRNRYPFDMEIICILLIAFVAVAIAGFSDSAFGIFKAYFFEPILAYLLIFNVFFGGRPLNKESTATEEPDFFKAPVLKIIGPLALSAFFVSGYAILQKFGLAYSPENFWPRVTGVFFYPNALGLYLGPLVPVMAGYSIFNFQFSIFKQFSIHKFSIIKILFLLLTIILSISSIFYARSEGAMIGLAAAFLIIAVLWIATRFKLSLLIPKIFVYLILFFVIASPFIYLKLVPEHKYFNFGNPALNYIADKTMLKDFSGEVRKQQWRETWKFLTASPKNFIFGAGLSGYQAAIAPYHQEGIFFNHDRDLDFRRKLVFFDDNYKQKYWRPVEIYMYPHNFILNVWTELGLSGVFLFIWLLIKMINYQFSIFAQFKISNLKFLSFGLIGSFIAVIVHGLVDVPYFKNDLAVMFWVMIALASALNLENRKPEQKSIS